MNKFEKCKGKTLVGIDCEPGDYELTLIFDTNERIKFYAIDECCSNSWIEHCDHPTVPSIIQEFKQIPIPDSFLMRQQLRLIIMKIQCNIIFMRF